MAYEFEPSPAKIIEFVDSLSDSLCIQLNDIILQPNARDEHNRRKPNNTSSLPSAIVGDWLYLGNHAHCKSPKTINSLGITHILVCSDIIPAYFLNDSNSNLDSNNNSNFIDHPVTYARLPIDDWYCVNAFEYFEAAAQFIDLCNPLVTQNDNCNHKILVHCQMGKSRSSTMVIAYLMSRKVELNRLQNIKLQYIVKGLMEFKRDDGSQYERDDSHEEDTKVNHNDDSTQSVTTQKMRFSEAYYYVQCCRTLIEPNCGFMLQLEKYENICYNTKQGTLCDTPLHTIDVNNRKLGKMAAKIKWNNDGSVYYPQACQCVVL